MRFINSAMTFSAFLRFQRRVLVAPFHLLEGRAIVEQIRIVHPHLDIGFLHDDRVTLCVATMYLRSRSLSRSSLVPEKTPPGV